MSPTIKAYLLAMLERAIKTAAQTFLALVGTSAALGDVDWRFVGSAVALATVLSVVTSLASISLTNPTGPAAFGPEQIKD